jgi:hypothetical protein
MSDKFLNRPPQGQGTQQETGTPQYERGVDVLPPWTPARFKADVMPGDRDKLQEVTGIDPDKEYLVLGVLSPDDDDEGPKYLLAPADMSKDEMLGFKMEDYLQSGKEGKDPYYQVPINFIERAAKQ